MAYKQSFERNKRLKKAYLNHKTVWFDEDKNRYIKYNFHDKDIKKYCKRITRRILNNNLNRVATCDKASYKKEFDYWWTID